MYVIQCLPGVYTEYTSGRHKITTTCPTFVASWFLRSVYVLKWSVFFGILTCSHAWFTTTCTRQQYWTARTTGVTRVYCDFYWRREVGECTDTWYKSTDSAYWDSGTVADWQLANAPVWIRNNWWAYCSAVLWVTFVSKYVQHWTYYSTLHVICGCRVVQTNSAETLLALQAL